MNQGYQISALMLTQFTIIDRVRVKRVTCTLSVENLGVILMILGSDPV